MNELNRHIVPLLLELSIVSTLTESNLVITTITATCFVDLKRPITRPQVDREARVIAAGLRLQEANRDYLEFRQQRRDMRRLQRLEADGAQVEGLQQRDAEAYIEARRTVVAERRRDRAPAAVPALRARRPHAP